MASRFVFKKLASRMSGSTSLLCARAFAASARDVAPLTRCASEGGIGALSSFFHESAAHPCMVVASSRVMLSYEGRVRDLSNLLHGASAHPSTLAPKHCGIHGYVGYAAKYLNPLPCSCPAGKMSNPTTGMTSHHTKPASVDSVGGVKRTFSSSLSGKSIGDRWENQKAAFLAKLEAGKETLSEVHYEAKKAAIIAQFDAGKAEWKAEKEASEARIAGYLEKMNKQTDEFMRFVDVLLFGLCALALVVAQDFGLFPRGRGGKKSQAGAGDAAEENHNVA